MNRFHLTLIAVALANQAAAQEVTLQNDSLTDFGEAVIVTGFLAGGGAGSWLTSPCEGNLVAAQVFWRSQSGASEPIIHDSIRIYRSGTYPNTGALAESIVGPVLTDGVLNEWRHLDENQVVPLSVPVDQSVSGIVALGTSGSLVNTATAVVPGGIEDPDPDNNTATVVTELLTDPIFEDRFED